MVNNSLFRRLSVFSRHRRSTSKQIEPEAEPGSQEKVPDGQTVLHLPGIRQQYELTRDHPLPTRNEDSDSELLVKVKVIGLNPIDWKAPDFNFGVPELPYVAGREFTGTIVKGPKAASHVKEGDHVIVISTDYRDLRKAAFQEYAVASSFNTVRLPPVISLEDGATLGVAFVAAALFLGVCIGVDFSATLDGPDLFSLLRSIPPDSIPEDVRRESLNGIKSHERAQKGDWIAIWGASATSANLTVQLARLAGLKVVAIVDKAKHGLRLSNHHVIKPDFLVDSHDPVRAVDIIQRNLGGKLRFGLDTRGRETAAQLLRALSPGHTCTTQATKQSPPSPPATPQESTLLSAHLAGLTGLPKQTPPEGVIFHTVPIKLFHEVPEIGGSLVIWLEKLLEKGLIIPPEVLGVEDGLESINGALDRMRKGEVSGGKLLVRV